MMNAIKARMNKQEDEGFTLIELLVVVLIIGILMAIAIPTFLSLTGNAKANAAQSDLTTASQDEATYFTQNGSYDATGNTASATDNIQKGSTNGTGTNLPGMQGIDPGVNWSTGVPASTTAGTKTDGVTLVSSTEVVLATVGQNGSVYYVDDNSGKLQYDKGTTTTTMPTTAAPVTWGSSWATATSL